MQGSAATTRHEVTKKDENDEDEKKDEKHTKV